MRRARVLGVLGLLSCAAAACGVFSGSDSATAPPPTDAGAVPDAGSVLPTDSGGNTGPAPLTCIEKELALVTGDALLAGGSDQGFGTLAVCNVHTGNVGTLGVGVLRFRLSAAGAQAVKTGSLLSMKVVLTKAITDSNCGPDAGSCNNASYDTAGDLTLVQLRTDWNEAQVTWIHRDKAAGTTWQSPGAGTVPTDRGNVAAKTTYDTGATLVFDVDAGALVPALLGDADQIAFVVATSGGNITFITREAVAPSTPLVPPVLEISYPCVDGG